MKKAIKYLLLILTFYFTILSPDGSNACGTVKGWVDIYLNDRHSKQDRALYMINCKPVITKDYKATPRQQEALAKMIRKGIKSIDYCDRNLAVKNFFLFDQLFWLQGSDLYDEIVADIESRMNRPVHEISGELSLYEREGKEDYCARVNYEIKSMHWNGEAKCITSVCKEIDMHHFKEKFDRIANFTNRIGKCLNENPEKSAGDRIVQVKSDILKIRKRPAPKGVVVSNTRRHDFLLVKSEKNGWLKVVNKSCKEGWVAGYLTKDARSGNSTLHKY